MVEDGVSKFVNDVALVRCCLTADSAAIGTFQATYGPLIYAYPSRAYGISSEEAGDFYLYAFEDLRIFRRMQSYEGRASLKSYLCGFVLDHLVLEWRRRRRELPTVPLDAIAELPDPEIEQVRHESNLLALLPRPKALILKLLFIEDHDLTPADMRQIAETAGKRIREVVAEVDQLRRRVRDREERAFRTEDSLATIHAWVQLYERRLAAIDDDLEFAPPTSAAAARLRDEQRDITRRLLNRRRQRQNVIADLRRRKVTAPYKEIADLLRTSINNVASQIRRARAELSQQNPRALHRLQRSDNE